jgi:hypothetical protein
LLVIHLLHGRTSIDLFNLEFLGLYLVVVLDGLFLLPPLPLVPLLARHLLAGKERLDHLRHPL